MAVVDCCSVLEVLAIVVDAVAVDTVVVGEAVDMVEVVVADVGAVTVIGVDAGVVGWVAVIPTFPVVPHLPLRENASVVKPRCFL